MLSFRYFYSIQHCFIFSLTHKCAYQLAVVVVVVVCGSGEQCRAKGHFSTLKGLGNKPLTLNWIMTTLPIGLSGLQRRNTFFYSKHSASQYLTAEQFTADCLFTH